jgi:hypothetical protein
MIKRPVSSLRIKQRLIDPSAGLRNQDKAPYIYMGLTRGFASIKKKKNEIFYQIA